MNTNFTVIWPHAVAIVFGGVFANVLANMAFAVRAVNTSVTQILRTRE